MDFHNVTTSTLNIDKRGTHFISSHDLIVDIKEINGQRNKWLPRTVMKELEILFKDTASGSIAWTRNGIPGAEHGWRTRRTKTVLCVLLLLLWAVPLTVQCRSIQCVHLYSRLVRVSYRSIPYQQFFITSLLLSNTTRETHFYNYESRSRKCNEKVHEKVNSTERAWKPDQTSKIRKTKKK